MFAGAADFQDFKQTPIQAKQSRAKQNKAKPCTYFKGMFRHILIDPGYKRMGQGASFTHTRVSNEVASQWMTRTRVLFDSVTDGRGSVAKIARYPADSVPDPR